MPITLLWAVDVYGRVYSLSTAGQRWERADDLLLELKRVTAGKGRCWGIGCDHHVYLNMMPSETPIRYREETYENQRWNPVDSFTDTLLPTDRWPWSDVTGMNPQPLHSFELPSRSWEWEGDWYVDQSCGGEPSQTGGWEYAVDFPANFSPDKKWNSCVRRRRWIRYRRYIAQGTWAKIPLDSPRKPPLPLCDISCGGWEMSDQSGRYPYLWGVTQQGQVWFREGIHPRVPEGTNWEEVEVPKEVAQLSAGPGDLLWALLWDGNLLVRTGLTLDSPTGTSWVEVESPGKDVEALHVAVGVSVVWVVTKDYKVWFRRGVNSHNPCGSGWISIGGEMITVDVGLNDQVWAVGEDRGLYFRMGVTLSEPSGNGWIPVSAEWGNSKEVIPPRKEREFGGQLTDASQGSVLSCTDSDSELGPADPENSTKDAPVLEAAAPSVVPLGGADSPSPPLKTEDAPSASQQDAPKPFIPASDSFINSLVSDRDKTSTPQLSIAEVPLEEVEEPSPAPILRTPETAGHDVPWMNVDLEGAEAARCAQALGSSSGDGGAAATYALGTLETSQGVGEEDGPVWAWISGGGCDVDADSQISWLSPTGPLTSSLSLTPVQSAAWSEQQQQEHREEISKKPLERSNSVWVRKGALRWWRDWKPQRWVDVGVALEQSTKSDGKKDSIFFVYYTQYDEKKYLHVFINEVTALVPVLRDCHYAFAVYTAQRTKQRWPLVLAAQTEKDMNDWLCLLSDCCCECRGITGPPSRHALWSTTSKGDIMVHEPSFSLEAPAHTLPCDHMFWRQVLGHLRCVESNSLGLVWGIGCDGTAWVYSGRYGQQPTPEDAVPMHQQTDVRSVHVYENQRWNPMTGYTDKGLPTDRPMWSDESGLKECTKGNTHPPSPQWSWVSEWAVDYNVPGGTDKEGWQYAADFPVTFHGHKTMKDFVRRRRWTRKCKITLRGPWQQVPPIRLSDISLMPCLAQSRMEHVPVWALSDKGDVLCRLGVSPQNPAGSSWLHVGTDQPFKSISIGGANQVWAIAKDGAVFYRGSVSPQNPAGECWYHIPSPLRQTLKQLSVGRTSVFAVDENSNLWYRQGLTPSYPQGSAWEPISNNVTKVSVGPLDQVWIIADGVPCFPSETTGAVCHRLGVGPMQPKGQLWDYGIGGGWEHISVRGNSAEAPRTPHPAPVGSPRSPLPPRPPTQVNGNAVGV
ncbi:tectonin beta-propeller repeat-containing protein 1 [Epinephelus fuscoguttatus]|uniref:tectonin beta-propeller repeat-containing protein 1 n=1 Tax=Epinephelus fuscoguttatus TaxID=293821 RepID=UPI0020D199C0|nr:tectonin beta-propeller repeat-containing protein 1 [Epinephelus fuscoguttatus]XP_049416327.1 tectonin beta-propeller repeat-containing protein 1 [Epinephelus fuscoguttatus]XP_049416328.1 tectonin beta-propeller repeat-containing protein 1 [Epinephelus fuscoguttatus]XP_049416329.1 tectonin beta-propeller repeat-containing protein 1 [Epinephelus fuscoguttatus]XP_049416330.1 tectonin beta-propeller repeat-containing protein 1 [Epinephelus fuscoguttatus]XP_049416331.1 tectonin beta-propeller r